MENYLKKTAESEEVINIFNPQHWMDSSGGLTKGKMYGAPYVDVSGLHGDSQSSTNAHQRCTPTASTQAMPNQFSVEEIVQWVLEKLKESPDLCVQSAVDSQTTDHVVASSQPVVLTSGFIPDQSNMPNTSHHSDTCNNANTVTTNRIFSIYGDISTFHRS